MNAAHNAAPVAAPTRAVPWPWRLLALAVVLGMTLGLYVGGAKPMAVGLFTPPWDKLAHALTFGLIGAASGLASGRRGVRLLLWGLAGALLVGSMDEWHQRYLPGRSAGWDDLLADALGGLLGAGLLQGLYHWQLLAGAHAKAAPATPEEPTAAPAPPKSH